MLVIFEYEHDLSYSPFPYAKRKSLYAFCIQLKWRRFRNERPSCLPSTEYFRQVVFAMSRWPGPRVDTNEYVASTTWRHRREVKSSSVCHSYVYNKPFRIHLTFIKAFNEYRCSTLADCTNYFFLWCNSSWEWWILNVWKKNVPEPKMRIFFE